MQRSMQATGITAELANFLMGTRWKDLPEEVRKRAAFLLTDTLGNIIGGQSLESTQALIRALSSAGILDGDLPLPGSQLKASPFALAYISGAAAHGFDFDDTHANAQIHPGAPVVSAALAAAALNGSSTDSLLTGIVVGYEAMARVSYGLTPDVHSRRGFHLTATTGVFGAAAAAGSILGVDSNSLQQAWGSCLSMAAGSGQFMFNGAWTKRIHVGHAAANGLLAVQMTCSGVSGALEALEGRDGFWNLYSEQPEPQAAVRSLGSGWEIMHSAIKPYPCCRAMHAPVDAIFALQDKHEFDAADILAVQVGVPERCHMITCLPEQLKRHPQSQVDAQFSMYFCIAQALVSRSLTISNVAEGWEDEQVLDMIQKIDTFVDQEADSIYPQSFPGRVRIELRNGDVLEQWVELPTGEPDKMLSATQLQAKFMGLTEMILPRVSSEELFALSHGCGDSPITVARLLSTGNV